MTPLLFWHELEITPSIDDLPEVLRRYARERLIDGEQSRPWLMGHVLGDGPRAIDKPFHQGVRRKLHLSLAYAHEGTFLALCAQRPVQLKKTLQHGLFNGKTQLMCALDHGRDIIGHGLCNDR